MRLAQIARGIYTSGKPTQVRDGIDALGTYDLKTKVRPIVAVNPFLHYGSQNYSNRLNLLIKTKPQAWPDKNIVETIENITPNFIIDVEPRNII